MSTVPWVVIPRFDDGPSEEVNDCERASVEIAAKATAANTRGIARRTIVAKFFLPKWPARLPATPAWQVNKKRDSEIQFDDLIVSPLIGIAISDAACDAIEL